MLVDEMNLRRVLLLLKFGPRVGHDDLLLMDDIICRIWLRVCRVIRRQVPLVIKQVERQVRLLVHIHGPIAAIIRVAVPT